MNAARLLTEFSTLNAGLDEALTRFGADDDKKKDEGGGNAGRAVAGAAAGAAAVGAGVQAHRGVMRHAQANDVAPGVGNAYKAAGQRVASEAQDSAKKVKRAWQYPRQQGKFMADPGTTDRVRTAAQKAGSEGMKAIRKIVKTVTHYDRGPLDDVTALCAQADEAITKFAFGAADEEEPPKKRGAGGSLLAAAAAGAGGAVAHRKVMSAARNQGPLPGGMTGVGQAYRQAGAQVADKAADVVSQVQKAGQSAVDQTKAAAGKAKSLWRNFRTRGAAPLLRIAG